MSDNTFTQGDYEVIMHGGLPAGDGGHSFTVTHLPSGAKKRLELVEAYLFELAVFNDITWDSFELACMKVLPASRVNGESDEIQHP